MFQKLTTRVALALTATSMIATAGAADVPITGNVESKCVITTDTPGVYGNPTSTKLSTATTDGGVAPVVRYDVILAEAYKAVISYPESFSSSPTLNDTVTFTGSASVSKVSSAEMSGYEAAKRTYNNTTEVDLTIAGSTWFKVESSSTYGYGKSFPGGTYRAVVSAECIAL